MLGLTNSEDILLISQPQIAKASSKTGFLLQNLKILQTPNNYKPFMQSPHLDIIDWHPNTDIIYWMKSIFSSFLPSLYSVFSTTTFLLVLCHLHTNIFDSLVLLITYIISIVSPQSVLPQNVSPLELPSCFYLLF